MRHLVILLFLAGLLRADSAPEIHDYLETTGGEKTEFRWTLYRDADEWRLESRSGDETHVVFCQPDGTTRQWTLEREGTRVVAMREGHTLRLEGTVDGKPCQRKISLGDEPWLQALSLALGAQAANGVTEQVFWMIRPDNLQAVKLKAANEGKETITLDEGAVEAQRVRVGSPSRTAGLWYSHYWFRTDDHVFVRYEGVFGLPFVPRTTVVIQLPGKEP
jgi:hypothetical protein